MHPAPMTAVQALYGAITLPGCIRSLRAPRPAPAALVLEPCAASAAGALRAREDHIADLIASALHAA